MLNRRQFLVGVVVVTVAAVPIISVVAIKPTMFKFQTWPWGSPRPSGEYHYGTVGADTLARLQAIEPTLVWKTV